MPRFEPAGRDPMWLDTLNTARDLGRMREIARVLAKHGVADLSRRLGLTSAWHRACEVLRLSKRTREPSTPARLRMALEELGPTFVKLGQLLAGRADLLPPEWIRELALLRERAAAVPFDRVRIQLETELGDRLADFAQVDPTPLAAASIAQVHRARLSDGRELVLKVRRPNAKHAVEADLRLMARIAARLEDDSTELKRYQPRAIVRQLASSLRNEIDFRVEARATERFARMFAGRAGVVIPCVHAAYSTASVLALDFLDGESLDRWIARGRPGDRGGPTIARAGAQLVLEMIFVHGAYHADPHGGNVLMLADGRLGLIDFGMVGRLTDARRRELLGLLGAVIARREPEIVDRLLDWCAHGDGEPELLAADVGAFLDRYHGATLRELDLSEMLRDIAAIVRDNELVLPADVAMLLKVFITLDALGRDLDPAFRLSREIEPFVRRAAAEERAPIKLLLRGAKHARRMVARLPSGLAPALTRMQRRGLRLDLDLRRLDQFGRDVERSANRLAIGVVTAASIVGTSIVLTVGGGQGGFGVPSIALIAFLSSLGLGAALLVSIARSRRR